MSTYIQVATTLPSKKKAKRLAARLIEHNLAACVQVSGPIISTYRWQGQVEESEEWVCVAKTLAARFGPVEQAIRQSHPYDVPEIIATPLTDVSADYGAWMDQQLLDRLEPTEDLDR